MPHGIPHSDKDFQAEMDARTLREAQEVRADSERLKRAKAKLREEAKAAEKALDGESHKTKKKPAKKKRRKRGFMGGFPMD